MTIAFVHHNKAFLPELNLYAQFFSRHHIHCEIVIPAELHKVQRQVDWYFMGIDTHRPQPGVLKIHEYASPSTPPFASLKNWCKSIINSTPHARVFQSEFVKKSFSLNHKIPYFYRDVGIPSNLLLNNGSTVSKEFDFIYIGDLSPQRQPGQLINLFTQPPLQGYRLLLLGSNYTWLQKEYEAYPNIIFKGPVAKEAVRNYIQKARFGINFIRNINPYNQLASTKFLEYAACKVPIITTDYAWVRQFQQQYGGRYFYLQPNLSNFTWQQVTGFDYAFPDLHNWTWEHQLQQSGLPAFLQTTFPEQQLRFSNI